PSHRAIAAIADLVERARRPLVLAGRGAVLAGARRPLEELADRIGALLATSAPAHGLFAGSPWSLGISGGFASPLAQELLPQADHFQGFPPMHLRVPDAQGFVMTQAFQSIGLGLATGIGAAVARPDRPAVAVVGDGGLMMSLGELDSAAAQRLALLVVVLDD